MNIKMVLTRTIAYGIVTGCVLLSVGLTLYFLYQQVWAQVAVLIFLGLFWSVMGEQLRALVQTPLEEKWIKDAYDSETLIDQVACALMSVVDKQEVFRIIADKLHEAIHLKRIDAFVVDDNDGKQVSRSVGQEFSKVRSLKETHLLIRYFMKNSHAIELKKLDHTIQESLKEYCFDQEGMVIPFFSPSKLEGILVVGGKISEAIFTEQDKQVFSTLQNQVLLVLDRIRPYETIKQQVALQDKQAETLEESLSVKNQEFKELAYWVTHDLNNALSGLRLFVTNISEPTEKEHLQVVVETINSLRETISQFLNEYRQMSN